MSNGYQITQKELDYEWDREKKVLKEGSEAGQFADQQADCGKIDSNTQQADCGEKKYAAVSHAMFVTTNGEEDMNEGEVKEG